MIHEWHDLTPEGDTRFVRAQRHAGRWQFGTTLKSDAEWTSTDALAAADLRSLLEILQRKYQRRRVPYEHILEVERMLETADELDDPSLISP